MTARHARRGAASGTVYGIDWMVRNVWTGRFERSLSALTAVRALVTAERIHFEHDSASFGNMMIWPTMLPVRRPTPQVNQQVSRLCAVWNPVSLSFQVNFGHYQRGSRIVPSILADSGCHRHPPPVSGLDLYGLVLAPCLLGCAGTSR